MGSGSRWLVAVITSLVGFAGCWSILTTMHVLDTGTQIGLASIPLVVILTVLGAWAENRRDDDMPKGQRISDNSPGEWDGRRAESRVLDAMEPEVGYDVAQISSSAGIAPSDCREALRLLIADGLVKEVEDRRGSHRFIRIPETRKA